MNVFHLLNRGVEKRRVFLTQKDYLRFVHNLKDFNTSQNVQSYFHRRHKHYGRRTSVASVTFVNKPASEELVDILCWCLLPNHPHIMVMEKSAGKASAFSKKIFGGYTKYFNEQNKRSGVLFQGRSKIILVRNEAHFLYLHFYVHLNALDLFQPDWRGKGVRNVKKAMNFLKNYPWSSYQDLTGGNNFSGIVNKNLFYDVFGTNEARYEKDLICWLNAYKGDFREFSEEEYN